MKEALVVVDYQVDFVDGALGFDQAKSLEEGICQKIQAYRDRGQDVYFTLDTHTEHYLQTREGKYLPTPHCIKPKRGWQLYGAVRELAHEEECIEKPAFGSIELAKRLQAGHYDQVELVGLVSHICVLSNAVLAKAALFEAEIVIDASLTASFDPKLHQAALDLMKGLQMRVINE